MSLEVVGLIIAFIGGVLVDHFLINNLFGMVTGEVASLKADVAGVVARMPIHTLPAPVVAPAPVVVAPAAPAPAAPHPAA